MENKINEIEHRQRNPSWRGPRAMSSHKSAAYIIVIDEPHNLVAVVGPGDNSTRVDQRQTDGFEGPRVRQYKPGIS